MTVLLGLLALGAFAVLAFRTVRAVQQERLIAEARSAGLAAYEAGDLPATLQNLSYVFQYRKDDLQVNLTFAEARARQPLPGSRHLLEAVDLYANHGLRLIESEPALDADGTQRRRILERLLELYAPLGLRFEVNTTATELLAIDPDHLQAMAALAEVRFLDAQFDEALAHADRLMELDPHELKWRRLYLDILRESGAKMPRRLEQVRAWANEYQHDGRFHLLAAALLLEQDRRDEAAEELQRLAELGVSDQAVLERAVSLLDLLDLHHESERLLVATRAKFPSEAWPREVAVRRMWRQDRLDEALHEIQQAERDLHGLTADLQKQRVVALLGKNDARGAAVALQPLLQSSPRDQQKDADRAWAQALASVMAHTESPWRDRLDALQRALALVPDDPVLHFLLASAWSEIGERAQAIALYQAAAALDPDWLAAGVAYAQTLIQAGRWDEAYRTSRLLVSRSAQDEVVPFLVFARAYLALRYSGRAQETPGWDEDLLLEMVPVLERLHHEDSDYPEVASLLVEALAQQGEAQRASEVMLAAAERAQPNADVLLAMAESALRHGLSTARPVVDRLQQLQGFTPAVALALAEAHAMEGDPASGLNVLNSAVASNPEEPGARLLRTARLVYQVEHRLPRAAEALAALMRQYPDSVEVQQLVLSQPQAWLNAQVPATALANLKQVLGDHAPQVRLAEANLLLRQHGGDEAMLARAIMQIEAVLERTPDSLAALSLMAEAMMQSRQPNLDRAITCLEHAANLYVGEPSLVLRLVPLLHQRGDYAKAGRYLRYLAGMRTSSNPYRREELRLWQAHNDFDSALVRAAALVDETSPPDEQLILAAIHQRAGQREQAQAIYDRMLSRPDPSPLVLSQAAEFFAAIGDLERGLEILQRLPFANQGEKNLQFGRFHHRHGLPERASRYLQRAVQLQPHSAEARLELARHLLSVGDRRQAHEHALAGLQLDPDDVDLQMIAAVSSLDLSGEGRLEGIARLRRFAAGQPEFLALLDVLERVPLRNGRPAPNDDNLRAARRLIQQHGRFLPAWQLAITLNVEAGRMNEAIALARSAVSRFPAHAEPSQWATELLMNARQWPEALVEALEWRRRASGEPIDEDIVVAMIYLELGRAEDAVKQLERHAERLSEETQRFPARLSVWIRALALSARPDSPGSEKRYAQAVGIMSPLLPRDSRWRELWLDIAAELHHDFAEDACDLMERYVNDSREMLRLAAVWTALGKQTRRAEQFDRAEALATRAAADERLASLVARGAIAEARRDWHAAEHWYRRALEVEPNHAHALNNLAFVVSRSPQRADEALQLARRALTQFPDHPDYLDTYGQALLAMDRTAEAERVLRRALSLRPDDLGIAISLAEAKLVINDRSDEAHEAIRNLERRWRLERRPDPDLHERLERLRHQLQAAQASTGT